MRIVQVVLSLGMGGQERLVVGLAQQLRERGHESHVITLTAGGALRDELGSIPVHDVLRRDGFDPRLYVKLWRRLRSLRPDVVHSHNAAPLVYGAAAAKVARVRTVVHTKHGNFRYPSKTLKLARLASRAVDHFVAVSTETADAARENERPPASRLSVIENGIPLAAFGPDPDARRAIREELGIPRDAKVVGSVGRLVPEKDFPLLVAAMAPLLAKGIRLVLVGEGIARSDIEAAIAREVDPTARPNVILAGIRRDVPKLLASFDLFASSSRTEGLPLAIPEAMTSCLPVVATAVGGVPGIVPASAGMLVPHGDPSALRDAIATLLDDDAKRSEMGSAARAYATGRFAESRMLDEYLRLYAR